MTDLPIAHEVCVCVNMLLMCLYWENKALKKLHM